MRISDCSSDVCSSDLAIGFCVIKFTLVLGVINGVMKPTVTWTGGMMEASNKTIQSLLVQREKAVKETDAWKMYVGEMGMGNRDKWLKYTNGVDDNADRKSTRLNSSH